MTEQEYDTCKQNLYRMIDENMISINSGKEDHVLPYAQKVQAATINLLLSMYDHDDVVEQNPDDTDAHSASWETVLLNNNHLKTCWDEYMENGGTHDNANEFTDEDYVAWQAFIAAIVAYNDEYLNTPDDGTDPAKFYGNAYCNAIVALHQATLAYDATKFQEQATRDLAWEYVYQRHIDATVARDAYAENGGVFA